MAVIPYRPNTKSGSASSTPTAAPQNDKLVAELKKGDKAVVGDLGKDLGDVESAWAAQNSDKKLSDFKDWEDKTLKSLGITDTKYVDDLIGQEANMPGASNDMSMQDFVSSILPSFISSIAATTSPPPDGIGKSSIEPKGLGEDQKRHSMSAQVGDYRVEFVQWPGENNNLHIWDKNGKDIAPQDLQKNAKPGYVTLPDGSALYIGSGGGKAHAYALTNGKSFDITDQTNGKLKEGQGTTDFLNGTLPNGNVTGYVGDGNPQAGATYQYLKNYIAPPPPPPAPPHDLSGSSRSTTDSGNSGSSGSGKNGIPDGIGSSSDVPKGLGTDDKRHSMSAQVGDYRVEFVRWPGEDNNLHIWDKNGKDLAPQNLQKNATPGYVTLPDGNALYIGSGGGNAHAYALTNGKSFDITDQNNGQLKEGQGTTDFLDGSLPNGNVTGYDGPGTDKAGATYNYLKNYQLSPNKEGENPKDIDTQMAQASQIHSKIPANDQPGPLNKYDTMNSGQAMKLLVGGAASGNNQDTGRAFAWFNAHFPRMISTAKVRVASASYPTRELRGLAGVRRGHGTFGGKPHSATVGLYHETRGRPRGDRGCAQC